MRSSVIISFLLSILLLSMTYADENGLSLELQNANLPDAIRAIATFLNINVIISPTVMGVATLHLHNSDAFNSFNLLLTSHGLAKWQMGDVWLIAPRAELIALKQEELKWQEANEAASPLNTHVWRIRYGNALDIAHLLQDSDGAFVSKRGRVRVDSRTNIICVQDTLERLIAVDKLIRLTDVPIQQINIEARLVSVDSDFERELGIDFSVKNGDDSEKATINSSVATIGRYSIAVAKLADGSLLDVKLAALENEGHAELISRPSLFTASQQTASIEAGEEVPYQEVSESGGTAVAFKKAVLGLTVTPQVLPGKRIALQLKINQDRPSKTLVQGVPTISTRQMMTNIIAKNGETIVLGGIFETSRENGEERVPFLSQVPVMGWLFQQRSIRTNKRELLIFVTPKIIA